MYKCDTCKHNGKPWYEEPCDSCCGEEYEMDEAVLIVCNPNDADEIWKIDTDAKDILVMTELVNRGHAGIIPKKKFMRLLDKADWWEKP